MERYSRLFRAAVQIFTVFALLTGFIAPAGAFDADVSRETLRGLTAFYVLIEELNPNVAKYANLQKNQITVQTLKSQVESRLRAAGIRVLSWEEMLRTPEQPILYVSVNTHEYEKFWFAYNILVEVRQAVTLAGQPGRRISGATWSMNMTGVMNIGQLRTLYDSLGTLLTGFVEAHKKVNG